MNGPLQSLTREVGDLGTGSWRPWDHLMIVQALFRLCPQVALASFPAQEAWQFIELA